MHDTYAYATDDDVYDDAGDKRMVLVRLISANVGAYVV